MCSYMTYLQDRKKKKKKNIYQRYKIITNKNIIVEYYSGIIYLSVTSINNIIAIIKLN